MGVVRAAWLLCLVVPTFGVTLRGRVTPVEKVIELLGRLDKQVTEEGQKEAVEYDKFACFCKDQADSKTYAIEKSEKKIEELTATITKLDADLTELATEIQALGDRITEIEGEVKTETEKRTADHETYVTADKNVTGAIQAVAKALEAIEASKAQIGGGAKVDFAQIRMAARRALQAVSVLQLPSQPVKDGARALASLITSAQQPGQPHSYQYKSNDIIATLKALQTQFKENKKALDKEEFDAAAASDEKVLALSNEQKFKEKSKLEKEELSSKKTEEKHDAEQDKTEETTALNADKAFRDELASQCEAKAQEFDGRSKSRAAELKAIAEAVEALKTGVAPNYAANKKLVGLVAQRAAKKDGAARSATPSPAQPARRQRSPAMFLQVDGTSSSEQLAAVQHVLARISERAERLNSVELAALASRVELQEDHFVKVRALINDLVAKLQAEAESEATQKSFCDKQMAQALENRDKQSLAIEEANAAIVAEEAKRTKLLQDISTLSVEIADLNKALKEATELRENEKKDNEKTLAEAADGKAAVEQAIQVLQQYYGSFLQGGRLVGPADRDGNTISDLAPETSFSGEYKGNQDASKGIIGLLNVILSDFERTTTAVTDAETQSQTDFDTFKSETTASITAKEEEVKTKEGEVKTAEDAIVTAQGSLKDAEGLKETALKELEVLKSSCVEGEESFAERTAKREEEIAALKEALKILEEWKA